MDSGALAGLATAYQSATFGRNVSLAVVKQQQKAQEDVVNLITQSVGALQQNSNLPAGVGGNVNTVA